MWPRRKAPPTPAPEVTNDGYSRWLRAGRPPFEWFMRAGVMEQEQMALLGDAYVQDVAVAIGASIADPAAARDGVAALRGNVEGEVSMARRLAGDLATRILAERGNAPSVTHGTLAGFGERRVDTETDATPRRPTLFGREPTRRTS